MQNIKKKQKFIMAFLLPALDILSFLQIISPTSKLTKAMTEESRLADAVREAQEQG
jgi:hypothetical protein